MFIKFKSLDSFIKYIEPILPDLKLPILFSKPSLEIKDFYSGKMKPNPKMKVVLAVYYESKIFYCVQKTTKEDLESYCEKALNLKPLIEVNKISVDFSTSLITID